MTTISIPYALEETLQPILVAAGFEVGSTGGGTADYETDRDLSDHEIVTLKTKLADALFDGPLSIDVFDDGDDRDDDEDREVEIA